MIKRAKEGQVYCHKDQPLAQVRVLKVHDHKVTARFLDDTTETICAWYGDTFYSQFVFMPNVGKIWKELNEN